jgi:hypothetical protein
MNPVGVWRADSKVPLEGECHHHEHGDAHRHVGRHVHVRQHWLGIWKLTKIKFKSQCQKNNKTHEWPYRALVFNLFSHLPPIFYFAGHLKLPRNILWHTNTAYYIISNNKSFILSSNFFTLIFKYLIFTIMVIMRGKNRGSCTVCFFSFPSIHLFRFPLTVISFLL